MMLFIWLLGFFYSLGVVDMIGTKAVWWEKIGMTILLFIMWPYMLGLSWTEAHFED